MCLCKHLRFECDVIVDADGLVFLFGARVDLLELDLLLLLPLKIVHAVEIAPFVYSKYCQDVELRNLCVFSAIEYSAVVFFLLFFLLRSVEEHASREHIGTHIQEKTT